MAIPNPTGVSNIPTPSLSSGISGIYYQSWNTVRVGPKKDIIAGWARAAKNNKHPFGLSVHASHAWSWLETSQRSDKSGPLAGVPYDGRLTKTDGKGTWWEGLDPQELYAQDHALSEGSDKINSLFRQWGWGNGASMPSPEYCNKFYNRVVDLIDQFNPDLLYFDDSVLPLYPVSDVGLKIAAHYYNHNQATHQDKLEGVLFGKVLNEEQKNALSGTSSGARPKTSSRWHGRPAPVLGTGIIKDRYTKKESISRQKMSFKCWWIL